MESFSTRGLPAARKAAYWSALNSEAIAAMEITPRDIDHFDGELRREPIGPLTLMDVQSDAVRIRHTRSHIARATSPSYLLLTPLRGDFQIHVDREPPRRVATGSTASSIMASLMSCNTATRCASSVSTCRAPRSTPTCRDRSVSRVGRCAPTRACRGRWRCCCRKSEEKILTGTPMRFTPALAQGSLGFVAEPIRKVPTTACHPQRPAAVRRWPASIRGSTIRTLHRLTSRTTQAFLRAG